MLSETQARRTHRIELALPGSFLGLPSRDKRGAMLRPIYSKEPSKKAKGSPIVGQLS